MVVHGCNSTTQETEAGGSQILGQPGQDSDSNNQGKREGRKESEGKGNRGMGRGRQGNLKVKT
jgi:hypothetical protein